MMRAQTPTTWTPIAIVGMSLRRSGVSTPSEMLAALRAGLQRPDDPALVSAELSELAFDALEDAGLPLEKLRARAVGVFAGGSLTEEPALHATFGLRGPVWGCEGDSLETVYRACLALADGACEIAFAAGGDGSERGVLLLERLDRALLERHEVLAVLRATGVFESGAIEGGLRRVLAASGIDPADIGYIEIHGDDACVSAHASVYGRTPASILTCVLPRDRASERGVDGVLSAIRLALSVRHRELWPVPPLREPPQGAFLALKGRSGWPIPRRAIAALTAGHRPAHVIFAQADPELPPSSLADPPAVFFVPVSAYREEDLAPRAEDLVRRLKSGYVPADLAFSCAHHRSHLPVRAAVVAPNSAEMASALSALAHGEPHHCLIGPKPAGKVVWLYSDAIERALDSAEDLYREEPTFRDAVDEVEGLLSVRGASPWSRGSGSHAAASSFALQVGLTTWLRSIGIEPDAIVADGSGAYAAAWACGTRTLAAAAAAVAEAKEDWTRSPSRTPSVPFWVTRSRERQRFDAVLGDAAALGVTTAVSLGLGGPVEPQPVQLIPTLSGLPGRVSVRRAAAELFVRGGSLDWSKLAKVGARVPLGSYPWSSSAKRSATSSQ